eukprot:SAG31_NODE_204_length_20414_cov_19.143392_9_plen_64_part_00
MPCVELRRGVDGAGIGAGRDGVVDGATAAAIGMSGSVEHLDIPLVALREALRACGSASCLQLQ